MHWYDTSVYPLAALLVGLGCSHLLSQLSFKKPWIKPAILGLALIITLIGPYQKMVKSVYFPKISQTEEQYGYLIRDLAKHQPGTKEYIVWCRPFNGQVAFYSGVLNREKNYNIQVVNQKPNLEKGQQIVVCRDNQLQEIEKEGKSFEVVYQKEKCRMVRID